MDAAHKSTLYREVNLTMDAMLRQFESDEAAQFLCECRNAGCSRRLALGCREYGVVRSSGGYLVSLECIADSEVLHRADRYAAVAFRAGATAGETGSSPSESSGSESSPQGSSLRERSPRARSPWARSPRAPSRTGRSVSGPLSRPAVLRLVSTAGQARSESSTSAGSASTWASSVWGRPLHRQSQSARLLAQSAAVQERPGLQVPPAS
jgi:hypothetical protein